MQSGKLKADVISAGSVRVARAEGLCPYCEDHIYVTEPLSAVSEGFKAVLGRKDVGQGHKSEPTYDEVTFTCGCSEAHEGGPEHTTGCGTRFRIAILRA